MRDKLIEIMARATHGWAFRMAESLDAHYCHDDLEIALERIDEARQLAATALTALESAGFAVAPVEPSAEMTAMGAATLVSHAWGSEGEFIDRESAADVYRAMLKAAKEG